MNQNNYSITIQIKETFIQALSSIVNDVNLPRGFKSAASRLYTSISSWDEKSIDSFEKTYFDTREITMKRLDRANDKAIQIIKNHQEKQHRIVKDNQLEILSELQKLKSRMEEMEVQSQIQQDKQKIDDSILTKLDELEKIVNSKDLEIKQLQEKLQKEEQQKLVLQMQLQQNQSQLVQHQIIDQQNQSMITSMNNTLIQQTNQMVSMNNCLVQSSAQVSHLTNNLNNTNEQLHMKQLQLQDQIDTNARLFNAATQTIGLLQSNLNNLSKENGMLKSSTNQITYNQEQQQEQEKSHKTTKPLIESADDTWDEIEEEQPKLQTNDQTKEKEVIVIDDNVEETNQLDFQKTKTPPVRKRPFEYVETSEDMEEKRGRKRPTAPSKGTSGAILKEHREQLIQLMIQSEKLQYQGQQAQSLLPKSKEN